jgi:hypothetical protein
MAVFTAVVAAMLSVVGSSYASRAQLRQALMQKELDLRREVYLAFLAKVDRRSGPLMSEILGIGSLADRVTTDGSVQALEDRLDALLKGRQPQTLYVYLNSDLNMVRLAASGEVRILAEDLLSAVYQDFGSIQWTKHPPSIRQYYDHWSNVQREGIPYGWKERVSSDERLAVILTSRLFQDLLDAMAKEVGYSRR